MEAPKTMRALKINGATPGADAALSEVPVPNVKPGWVLVKVEAFGLNNSERLVRLEEIGQPWIAPAVVPGIECAGVVVDESDTDLLPGERVIACMGGMGREFDGSYAEFALLPRKNVARVPGGIDWSWAELGAFPETYLTAWGSLFECLQLQLGDTLLVRGATCGLGLAAIQLARALKVRVIATTHRAHKLQQLLEAGADEAVLDDGRLATTRTEPAKVEGANKVLDLVGVSCLRDTLRCVEHGGIVCSTGILGGVYAWDGFDPIKDIPNGVYLTSFFSNYPTEELFDALFAFMQSHGLRPICNRVFAFDDLPSALELQDAGSGGKIVVVAGRGGEIARLREALRKADAVIVGAGAGLSTSAGFTYAGERFERLFPDFIAKYGFGDMYSAGFYPFPTPGEQWAFWSRFIWCNRYEPAPKNTYAKLLSLVEGKDFFVITTNVDHQFQNAGWPKEQLFYTQGDYGLWQCSKPCHSETYDNFETVKRMVEEQRDMRVPPELVPRCPKCGRPMSMNLRADGTFVEDAGWHAAASRYQAFLDEHREGKVLYLELGVGGNTPGIIKYPFWSFVHDNPHSTYACINMGEAVTPAEIRERSILIDADIDAVLDELVGERS